MALTLEAEQRLRAVGLYGLSRGLVQDLVIANRILTKEKLHTPMPGALAAIGFDSA
jgi:hypothetical protein